jgi:fluoride ion exporter CrcB/FEX
MNWEVFFIISKWFVSFAIFGALLRFVIFKFIQKESNLNFKWGLVVSVFIGVFYSFITYSSFDSGTTITENYIVSQATLFGLFVASIIDRIETWIKKFDSSENSNT